MDIAESLKYPLAIRALHWLMALIILCMLAVGLIMTGLPKGDATRTLLYSLHKSFGVTVLVLAVLRLAIRLRFGAPPLPQIIPAVERVLAQLGHAALYGFMFAMPISGYLMSTFHGLPVRWFGLDLPKLVGVDRVQAALAADFHQYAAYLLIGLIAVHVSAVIKHYVEDHINLLKRMT